MTLASAQAASDGHGKIYITFSVTDAATGNPTFHLGDQVFAATNVWGGARVQPVVKSWGSFASLLNGSVIAAGAADIELAAAEYCAPSNGTSRMRVIEWLRVLPLIDVAVSVYQWNALETTQQIIWSGYISAISEVRFNKGSLSVFLNLGSAPRSLGSADISTIVQKAGWANAPVGSVGLMEPIVFGNASNTVQNYGNAGTLGALGFPMPGIRGVVVDEDQATARIKIRAAAHDGAAPAYAFQQPTADDPATYGDLWIYDPANDAYGMVDRDSYSYTNDNSKLEVVVEASPKVFFFFRPKALGPNSAAGLTDVYNIIDSNPANYSESTGADYSWGFLMPQVNFGGQIVSCGMVVDWLNAHATKNRQIRYGINDANFATAPGPWLRNKSFTSLRSAGIDGVSYFNTGRYVALDFTDHLGSDTNDAFGSGSFLTNSAGEVNQNNLEFRIYVDDLGGAHAGRDGARIYNASIFVEVKYPWVPTQNRWSWYSVGYWDMVNHEGELSYWEKRIAQADYDKWSVPATAFARRQQAIERLEGTQFFFRGRFRRDAAASSTYSGAVADVIVRPSDIAYYILNKMKGLAVNTTAGTLGNFIDPRTYGLAANANLLLEFGPGPVKVGEALEALWARFGVRVTEDAGGTWHVFPDDMNPHSSRVYGGTSSPRYIGKDDIEEGQISYSAMPAEAIQNAVQFRFSHGFPDRDPGAETSYNNHLSQKWFGRKATLPVDEPCCIQQNLRAATQQYATDLAQWYGRRRARPRLTVNVRLKQSFYDLKRGHTLMLDNLEAIGLHCGAYRAGLLDYYFKGSGGGTDYADSLAAVLIDTAGASELYLGLSQQTDQVTFPVGTAAAYTTVANGWEYSVLGGFSAFSSVVNPDGLKSTGSQTISWARPNYWTWIKQDLALGGTTYGPCYWIRMKYTAPVTAGATNGRIGYPGVWRGRGFEVVGVRRVPGRRPQDYPLVDAVLAEYM